MMKTSVLRVTFYPRMEKSERINEHDHSDLERCPVPCLHPDGLFHVKGPD